MAWGMSLPSSFGDYWPSGDFESLDPQGKGGWRDRLDRYYQSLSPEEQKAVYDYSQGGDVTRYPTYVSCKFRNEIGDRPSDFRELAPLNSIRPNEPPQSFLTAKSYTSLASIIALNYGLLAIDEHAKALIEQIESGTHQFYPIELRMPRGKIYPVRYYTLVIGQYIDGFVPEKSKAGSTRERIPGRYSYDDTRKGISGIAVSKGAIGETHLWRERCFLSPLICFSDQLRTAIIDAGLRLPKHHKMMEV